MNVCTSLRYWLYAWTHKQTKRFWQDFRNTTLWTGAEITIPAIPSQAHFTPMAKAPHQKDVCCNTTLFMDKHKLSPDDQFSNMTIYKWFHIHYKNSKERLISTKTKSSKKKNVQSKSEAAGNKSIQISCFRINKNVFNVLDKKELYKIKESILPFDTMSLHGH